MKKKSFTLLILSVAIISIASAGLVKHQFLIREALSTSIWLNAEVLASEEAQNRCYNGGVGASSCSIESGIDIFGLGVSSKCEVSCIAGYYACCGLRCTCIPYS